MKVEGLFHARFQMCGPFDVFVFFMARTCSRRDGLPLAAIEDCSAKFSGDRPRPRTTAKFELPLKPAPILNMVPMSTSKAKAANSVNDFTVLPIRISAQPSYPKETIHYLYVRPNAPRVPTEDTPRELFLVNVPIDATESHIQGLFADQIGGVRVETTRFEGSKFRSIGGALVAQGKKRKRHEVDEKDGQNDQEVGELPGTWNRELHRSGGTAVVTFVDQASAEAAMKDARRATKQKREINWGDGIEKRIPPLGTARYLSRQKARYPDPAALQESVDEFMAAFSAAESARIKALARQRAEPDEDGFITVTHGGRRGTLREEDAKAKEEEFKKRENDRIRSDFYRFQTRERKKEEARDLVKGFEEDAKRLEDMRRRRGKVRPEK